MREKIEEEEKMKNEGKPLLLYLFYYCRYSGDGAGKTLGRVYSTDHPIMQGIAYLHGRRGGEEERRRVGE